MAATKEKLRLAFASFDAVREKYSSYPDDDEQADTAWILGAPELVTLAAKALEELLYKDTFDARYRDAVKSKHEATDFLHYPSVKAKLTAIEDALCARSPIQAALTPTSPARLGPLLLWLLRPLLQKRLLRPTLRSSATTTGTLESIYAQNYPCVC